MADTPDTRALLLAAVKRLQRRPHADRGGWSVLRETYGRTASSHLSEADTLEAMRDDGVLHFEGWWNYTVTEVQDAD